MSNQIVSKKGNVQLELMACMQVVMVAWAVVCGSNSIRHLACNLICFWFRLNIQAMMWQSQAGLVMVFVVEVNGEIWGMGKIHFEKKTY